MATSDDVLKLLRGEHSNLNNVLEKITSQYILNTRFNLGKENL